MRNREASHERTKNLVTPMGFPSRPSGPNDSRLLEYSENGSTFGAMQFQPSTGNDFYIGILIRVSVVACRTRGE